MWHAIAPMIMMVRNPSMTPNLLYGDGALLHAPVVPWPMKPALDVASLRLSTILVWIHYMCINSIIQKRLAWRKMKSLLLLLGKVSRNGRIIISKTVARMSAGVEHSIPAPTSQRKQRRAREVHNEKRGEGKSGKEGRPRPSLFIPYRKWNIAEGEALWREQEAEELRCASSHFQVLMHPPLHGSLSHWYLGSLGTVMGKSSYVDSINYWRFLRGRQAVRQRQPRSALR